MRTADPIGRTISSPRHYDAAMDGGGISEAPQSGAPRLPAQVTGAGIGAVVGFSIGGPVGAIVGAMSEPVLIEVSRKAWEELTGRRRDNVVGLVAQGAARLGVEPDQLVETAYATDKGTALLADAIQGAATTLDQRKVAGLAKAVANGLLDDQAAIDESLLIVRAVADLEEAHVRLLGRLSQYGQGRTLTADDAALVAVLQRNGLAVDDAHERAVETADELFEATSKMLEEVAKALQGKRARVPAKPKTRYRTQASRTRPRWRRTSFGTRSLEHLYDAAVEVELEPMDERPRPEVQDRDGANMNRGDNDDTSPEGPTS